MKKILVLFTLVISISLVGQEKYDNQLNGLLNVLIKTQVSNQLESRIPLFVMVPGFFAYGEVSVQNPKIYFGAVEFEKDHALDWEDLINMDALRHIHLNLISNKDLDSAIRIKSFSESRLLLDVNYQIFEDYETVEYALPDNEFSRKFKYQQDRLVYIETKRDKNYILTDINYLGDSLVKYVQHNIDKQSYQQQIQQYQSGFLSVVLNYKPVKNQKDPKLNNRELYTYFPDGSLRKVITERQNGKILDSTTYEYFRQLTVVRHFEKHNDYNINIHYNQAGRVERKEIFSDGKSYNVEYFFDPLDRLLSMGITDNNKSETNKYTIQYNESGELIELKSYFKSKWSENMGFRSQYIFSYAKSGMIESIKSTDKKGFFTKEIHYNMEYLYK